MDVPSPLMINLCILMLGHHMSIVGHRKRTEFVTRCLLAQLPYTAYDTQSLLRQQPQPLDSIDTFSIIENPSKLQQLGAFVVADRWRKFESLIITDLHAYGRRERTRVVNQRDCDTVSSPLIARDKIEECRLWEASLSVPMKNARCGDLNAFLANVSASLNVLDKTDSMGYDVWFWALTGGSTGIIDYLLSHTSLQR